MATLEYYDILLKPVITEKSMEMMAEKKYTFLVNIRSRLPLRDFSKAQRSRRSTL